MISYLRSRSRHSRPELNVWDTRAVPLYVFSRSFYAYAEATARIYHASLKGSRPNWAFSGLKGRLLLGKDAVDAGTSGPPPGTNSWSFRLVDNTSGRTLWRIPILTTKFIYHVDRPFFHIFYGRTRRFGFRFDDDNEAASFYKEMTKLSNSWADDERVSQTPASGRKHLKTKMISLPTEASFVHVAHIAVNANGVEETSPGMDPLWNRALANCRQLRSGGNSVRSGTTSSQSDKSLSRVSVGSGMSLRSAAAGFIRPEAYARKSATVATLASL